MSRTGWMEQWQLSLQKRFAASTESLTYQGSLFNELETSLEPEADEIAADETITYARKKTRAQALSDLCRAKTCFTIFVTKLKSAIAVGRQDHRQCARCRQIQMLHVGVWLWHRQT